MYRKLSLLAVPAFALLATAATAGMTEDLHNHHHQHHQPATYMKWLHDDTYIPPNCIHPFDGKLTVIVKPVPLIGKTCNKLAPKYGYSQLPNGEYLGCSMGGVGDPEIWLKHVCVNVTDGTQDTYNHELAHCNGWPSNHPALFRCPKKERN